MLKIRQSRQCDKWALRYSLAMNALLEKVTEALGHNAFLESRALKEVRTAAVTTSHVVF